MAQFVSGIEQPSDYWLGKRYFECTVAERVSLCTGQFDTIPALDAHLEKRLRDYPYGKALGRLRMSLQHLGLRRLPNEADAYQAFVTQIGIGLRSGSSTNKKMMLDIIRELSGDIISWDSSDEDDLNDDDNTESSVSSILTSLASQSFSTDSSARSNVSEASLWLYTMKLKEIGDKLGQEPYYKTERSVENPAEFVTTVFFDGREARGVGRTLKESKHRASKEMCDALDAK